MKKLILMLFVLSGCSHFNKPSVVTEANYDITKPCFGQITDNGDLVCTYDEDKEI